MTQRVMQGIICKLSHKLSNAHRFRAWSPPEARFACKAGRNGDRLPHFGARLELTEIPNTGASNSPEEEAQLTERELSRGAARRLAMIQHVEEVTGNVAMTCRYFGISRHTFYRWLRRYQELGPEGLRERSRRPLVCPQLARSSTFVSTTTSAQPRSPCTSSDITTFQ